MKKVLIISAILLSNLCVIAQENTQPTPVISKVNLGIGAGLDYGGFGVRLSLLPVKNFALFGSVGYNIKDIGFNIGGNIRLAPDKKVCPNLIAMYGYNAVIVVKDAENYNKTYLGPTIGFGLEINTRNPKAFWNIELLLPFRSKEYKDDLQDLKDNPMIDIKGEPTPIALSIGYHIKF